MKDLTYLSCSGFNRCIFTISLLHVRSKNGLDLSEKYSITLDVFRIGIHVESCQDTPNGLSCTTAGMPPRPGIIMLRGFSILEQKMKIPYGGSRYKPRVSAEFLTIYAQDYVFKIFFENAPL